MSIPNKHPAVENVSRFSTSEETVHRSPTSFSEPFPAPSYIAGPVDMGPEGLSGGIEMRQTYVRQNTNQSFPGQGPSETQSFLHDPVHKIDTFYTSDEFQPYKDNTGRQLRHILVAGSARWAITAVLCICYVAATLIWKHKPAQSEGSKRMYNTITTGISIALGLNIASAFKDMALNIRWVILSNRKRNLIEMDLILHADSMQRLFKLVFITRRPMVILGCLFWLFINILAQAGIAMISLTYGFNPDTNHVQYLPGLVAYPNMTHFFPQGIETDSPSWQDQAWTAHMYGESAFTYGVGNDTTRVPQAGEVFQSDFQIFPNLTQSAVHFIFTDSPTDADFPGPNSVYTTRRINSTYGCESHKVTAGGDGTALDITVDTLGNVSIYNMVPHSRAMQYWVTSDSTCPDDNRCQIVQAFESSDTDAWYYKCNITVGITLGDPQNLSYISDEMAQIAASAIAQTGFVDGDGETGNIYPPESFWGLPLGGNSSVMGIQLSIFAIGTIDGASVENTFEHYAGMAPSPGVFLQVGHQMLFYTILGAITAAHLFFLLLVAYLANRVKVGPEGALSMALLLRPIADALDGVSGGKENQALKDAKKNTMIRYEKGPNGKWKVNMS